MNEKHTDATYNRPEGERILDAPGLLIDIPAFIRQIRSEDAWQNSDRNSITVFKTDDMRMVLGGLHISAELPPHRADGMMSIQVIEGLIEVYTDELSLLVQPQQVIAIHKGCNYRIIANEETIYLLTITDVA